MGVQREVDAETVQPMGDNDKRLRGEGVWHWDGMSDSEDEDWKDSDSNNGKYILLPFLYCFSSSQNHVLLSCAGNDSDDEDEDDKRAKQRLSFGDFDHLWMLLQAAAGSESILMESLERIGARMSTRGGQQFPSLRALQEAVAAEALALDRAAVEAFDVSSSSVDSAALFPYHEEEEAMVFLNMLYAPRRSRLFSILKVLTRIEHVGHICPWVKCKTLKVILLTLCLYFRLVFLIFLICYLLNSALRLDTRVRLICAQTSI